MGEHHLLTAASAIAFQVLTSLIPLVLLVLSVMGFLHLDEVWTDDLGPQFKEQVSKEVYAVADDVVRNTLGQEQGWWLTAGLVFTVWQVSGVARAIMGVLSVIYDGAEDRSFRRRYTTSMVLGTAVTVLVLLAFAIARFGRQVLGLDDPGFLVEAVVFAVRWGAALVFGLYVTQVADYNSIFGSLATVFVLLTYLYVSAVSFLIGAEVDAIVRDEWRA